MRAMLIACAALLAACSDLSAGPPLPPTPDGAQAPSELQVRPPARQAQISDEQRPQFEDLIRRYLDGAQERFAAGMREAPEAPEQVVAMQPGGDYRWRVELAAGTPYRFVGACDDDCSNLDFELIAPQGGVVASDLMPDDFPVASHTPSESGRYIARLMMIECSVAPCFAGARVLSGAEATTTATEPKPQP